MSVTTLREIYRFYGVRYKKVKAVTQNDIMRSNEYLKERIMSARRLLSLIMQNKSVIYFDESAFQSYWGASSIKAWANKG